MNGSRLHPIPRWADVLGEQVRLVVLASKRELALLGLLLAGYVVANAYVGGAEPGSSLMLLSELSQVSAFLAVFVPYAVWKGEEPSNRSYFWAMPSDRPQHTLARVWAGWVWLMVMVGILVAAHLLLSGILSEDVVVASELIRAEGVGGSGAAGVVEMRVADHPWFWLVLFASASMVYLVATVPVLASENPFWWYAGIWCLTLAASFAADLIGVTRSIVGLLVFGEVGLARWLTGLSSRPYELLDAGGQPVELMLQQPDLHGWLLATLVWGSVALGAVLIASFRHQEV